MVIDVTYLMESANSSYKIKNVGIRIDGSSEMIKTAISLCNKHWSEILTEAANRMYKHAESIGEIPEKFSSPEKIKKSLKLLSAMYNNEGSGRFNPICGSMDLSFDTKPSLDPHHLFTLYVDFDKEKNIKFDSSYDG